MGVAETDGSGLEALVFPSNLPYQEEGSIHSHQPFLLLGPMKRWFVIPITGFETIGVTCTSSCAVPTNQKTYLFPQKFGFNTCR